jgi:hypothetical protein
MRRSAARVPSGHPACPAEDCATRSCQGKPDKEVPPCALVDPANRVGSVRNARVASGNLANRDSAYADRGPASMPIDTGEAARPESVPLDAVTVSLPPHAAARISRVGEAVPETLICARAFGFARNQHGGSRSQRIVAVSDP